VFYQAQKPSHNTQQRPFKVFGKTNRGKSDFMKAFEESDDVLKTIKNISILLKDTYDNTKQSIEIKK
jgi:hypothetical protein